MTIEQRPGPDLLPAPRGVSEVLRAAAAPSEAGPQPGEGAALTAFRAAARPSRRSFMRLSLVPVKATAVAGLVGGLLLVGGVATAATGALPGAAQQTAHDMLAQLGISVPGPNANSAGHPDQRGGSTTGGTTTSSDEPVVGPAAKPTEVPGKGSEVSNLATTTDLTGVAKGAAISTLASDGKSKAGQNGATGGEGNSTEGRSHEQTRPTPTLPPASGDHAH